MSNQYRIFYVTKSKKQVNVHTFECKNDAQAYKTLLKYQLKHTDHKYYYGKSNNFIVQHDDGTQDKFDTPEDMLNFKMTSKEKYGIKEYRKGYEQGKKDMDKETKRNIDSVLKTGHLYGEWFSLDYHILEDLKFNLPILIKRHIGYPTFMTIKAKAKLTGKSEKELLKYNEFGANDETSELASKMWEEMLSDLLLSVKLYQFYNDHGIIDIKTKEDKDFYKKYKDTIPYVKGTYYELDYKKLYKLSNKYWNKIWDFMKKYGHSLWD